MQFKLSFRLFILKCPVSPSYSHIVNVFLIVFLPITDLEFGSIFFKDLGTHECLQKYFINIIKTVSCLSKAAEFSGRR